MDPARQALLDALQAHEPADDDERRDRDAIATLVAATPRCFDRDLYEPGHITGCVPGRQPDVGLRCPAEQDPGERAGP